MSEGFPDPGDLQFRGSAVRSCEAVSLFQFPAATTVGRSVPPGEPRCSPAQEIQAEEVEI